LWLDRGKLRGVVTLEQKYVGKFHTDNEIAVGYRQKIKNGSTFIIGGELRRVQITVHKHFNWFQKLMWKLAFGVTVEDYNEE
jgi:hypothetical protein